MKEEKMVDMAKMFPLTSICRDDVAMVLGKEKAEKLVDWDMKRLAEKMTNAYLENGYWVDLQIIVEYILEEKDKDDE